ncbi:MAG TPA: YdeI/OmpD-associated family protein, partial [Vicinamibacteria bacterium]|nr:YdeI/OmpD-associated family protein [Vicinamibacteria bacterium]
PGEQTLSAPIRGFARVAAFRAWLQRHHDREPELLVRCFKVHAADQGVTYAQALDEALCWGWIDGVRRSLDADSFSVRFSPRKRGSLWSAVNIRRAKELQAAGRMAPPGREAFDARRSAKGVYSFESKPTDFPAPMKRLFRANAAAFRFWSALPPGYRRTATFWVLSAKQEATRERRLAVVIACSARGQRIPLLARDRPPTASSARRKRG